MAPASVSLFLLGALSLEAIMLTPAEELGLSGLSLASRVRKAFFKIPEAELTALSRHIQHEAGRRSLIYMRDGQVEVTHVMPLPITVLPEQLAYIHYVTRLILNALKRLPELYVQDAAAREVLRLPAEEEEWLLECYGPSHRDHDPMFGRLDAMVDFISPMWKDSLQFVEPNLEGIGGLHIVPTAEQLLAEAVVPMLRRLDAELPLEIGRDLRELLLEEMLEHLQAVHRGQSAPVVCLIDAKYVGSGPEEQEELARYYHDRHGLKVLHADPAELTVESGEVYFQGVCIDLGYRDYAVSDLLELQQQGVSVEPMRTLFRQNRMISSITAELDQKSCWEIFTDPQYTQKFFNADERQVFRRHILWTRIVSDRATTLPDGRTGDLLHYIRHDQERLVLKPNRSYGGTGVTIGHLLTSGEWEAVLEKAVRDPARWVVQQLASIPVSEFPVATADGKVHFEPFYTVMGFAATKDGVAIVIRASQKQVVNVAQRGGVCVAMIGRPPGPLHGPQMKG